MSAWIVSKTHIDLMVSLGMHGIRGISISPDTAWGELRWFSEPPRPQQMDYSAWLARITRRIEDPNVVGQMLWNENRRSVDYRYNETNNDIPYEYLDPRYQLTLAEAVNLIGCYEYQSCEHDAWDISEAHAYCVAIKERLLDRAAIGDSGPWGWDEADVEKARAKLYPSVKPHGWTVNIMAGMSLADPCLECGLSKDEHEAGRMEVNTTYIFGGDARE